MRTYRRFRKGPRGARVPIPRWWIELRDHRNRVRQFAGFTDRGATEELARKVKLLAELRESHREPAGELACFVEGMPPKLREKLTAWDILDPRAASAAQPLTDLLKRFHGTLSARGNTALHARSTVAQARRVFDAIGASYWTQIDPEAVARVLADWRAAGMSVSTSNHLLVSCKGFTRWAWGARIAAEDPLRGLKRGNAKADRRHERRALSAVECRKLLAAAETGPESFGMDGRTRAMLYRLALESGLRRNELRTLRVASFDLADPARATVTVSAGYSKHRREDVLPIREGTANALRSFLAGMGPLVRPFPLPDGGRAAEMLRADLEAASEAMKREDPESEGIPYKTEAGIADFHALRHTFATSLARGGVHPAEAQKLMRHGSAGLTLDLYTHLRATDSAGALERALPDFDTRDDELRATGTDGVECPSPCLFSGSSEGASVPGGSASPSADGHANAVGSARQRVAQRLKIRRPQGHPGSIPGSPTAAPPAHPGRSEAQRDVGGVRQVGSASGLRPAAGDLRGAHAPERRVCTLAGLELQTLRREGLAAKPRRRLSDPGRHHRLGRLRHLEVVGCEEVTPHDVARQA